MVCISITIIKIRYHFFRILFIEKIKLSNLCHNDIVTQNLCKGVNNKWVNNKGQPDKYLIAMKYLETMKAITSGKDNKVVYMPYEATGILSSVDGIKQMFDKK